MCPVTLENALFFLDIYLANTLKDERKLNINEFQVNSPFCPPRVNMTHVSARQLKLEF